MIRNLTASTLLALLLASPDFGDAQNIRRNVSPRAEKPIHAGRVKGIKSKKPAEASNSNVRGGTQRGLQRNATLDEGDNGIIGGLTASAGEFPFYAKFEGGTLCGGSLINPTTILTAAHCVDDGRPNQVRLAAENYNSGGVLARTQCVVSHPDFIENDRTLMNDVAIMKLREPVTDATVVTIPYNNDTAFPSVDGSILTVIGFGITANNGNVASTLQKLNTNFVSIDKCIETYSDTVVTNENHICADILDAGDCNGDSGGPVFAERDGEKVQVGIVSFGYGGCASDRYQDVYVNVAQYSDWIKAYADGENCQPAQDSGVEPPTEDEVDNSPNEGDDVVENDDEEEPTDLDLLLDCFTTVYETVQALMGNAENAKGGDEKDDADKEDNKGTDNQGDNKNTDNQKGNGKSVTVSDFLWGFDGKDGPEPGFMGSAANFFGKLTSSKETFENETAEIAKALKFDQKLDEVQNANRNKNTEGGDSDGDGQ